MPIKPRMVPKLFWESRRLVLHLTLRVFAPRSFPCLLSISAVIIRTREIWTHDRHRFRSGWLAMLSVPWIEAQWMEQQPGKHSRTLVQTAPVWLRESVRSLFRLCGRSRLILSLNLIDSAYFRAGKVPLTLSSSQQSPHKLTKSQEFMSSSPTYLHPERTVVTSDWMNEGYETGNMGFLFIASNTKQWPGHMWSVDHPRYWFWYSRNLCIDYVLATTKRSFGPCEGIYIKPTYLAHEHQRPRRHTFIGKSFVKVDVLSSGISLKTT